MKKIPKYHLSVIVPAYLYGMGSRKQYGRYQRLATVYAVTAVTVLLASTAYWGLLSARLHMANADQLVDPYLFKYWQTFHEAVFPGQHTFLLKWPLFWLVGLLGADQQALVAVTVAVTLVTVGGLAFWMYRLERRPLVFGTLCLGLASVLMAVPAQPYPGALLPVNMAMLATRNVEYLAYIAALALLLSSRRWRSPGLWAGMLLLTLLFASDHLFMTVSLGGALLAAAVYALWRRWRTVRLALVWGGATVVAGLLAAVSLAVLAATHVTSFSDQGASGPYGVVHDVRQLVIGLIFGVLGLLVNFGANPAAAAVTVAGLPRQAWAQLTADGGAAYVINLAALLVGLAMSVALLMRRAPKTADTDLPARPERLPLALLWSTLSALGLFVVSNHYYPVDSRYLGIAPFAVAIAAAAYTAGRSWKVIRTAGIGLLLSAGVLQGVLLTTQMQTDSRQAQAPVTARNTLINQALQQHHVGTLVGDYWRVLPIRQISDGSQAVLPLDGCTRARQDLSSRDWQPDLRKRSFAYLLNREPGPTGFPACTLEEVTRVYGKPNASVVIAGKITDPKEVLLLYDRGIAGPPPQSRPVSAHANSRPAAQVGAVVPMRLMQRPPENCNGRRVMIVVAHQDDDLLFMNPDLQHVIREGGCVRTVYMTAGDAGDGQLYWLGRQQGSESAYAWMDGRPNQHWQERIGQLRDDAFLTVASPLDDPKLSLVFMHLPDGNLNGGGFPAYQYGSLARLEIGGADAIRSVDGQSVYRYDQVVDALAEQMSGFLPTEVWTQLPYNVGEYYPDHSDHMATGRYTRQAFDRFLSLQTIVDDQSLPGIRYYVGYPIRESQSNVSGADLDDKESAFFAYAKHDGSVCHSREECAYVATYRSYLDRQYSRSE